MSIRVLTKVFFLFIAVLIQISCATTPIPKKTSEYLLTTDKPQTILLNDISEALKEKKYEIHNINMEVGTVVTTPRSFSIRRQEGDSQARHVIQVRQEGGSVKVRIDYECQYQGADGPYEACYLNDPEARERISRIEPLIIQLLESQLFRN